jgi:hypothetical protein
MITWTPSGLLPVTRGDHIGDSLNQLPLLVQRYVDPHRAWEDGVAFLTRYYGPMDDTFLRNWLAAGPPTEVARRIHEYVDNGCSMPILRFAAWNGVAQLRRCLSEVMPLLPVTAP